MPRPAALSGLASIGIFSQAGWTSIVKNKTTAIREAPWRSRQLATLFLPLWKNLQHSSTSRGIRGYATTHASRSQAKPFTYSVSASYSAKRHQLNPAQNLYTHNPYHRVSRANTELSAVERALRRPRSGQDAFFVSNIGDTKDIAFGVVDGVGGWEDSGVDPADFAHSLCDYMAGAASAFSPCTSDSSNMLKPVDILDVGYRQVEDDKYVRAGGSTACIATVSSSGVLDVANLGDSGFAHLSPFRLNHVSEPQTHAFNTPFQLSKLSKKLLAQVKMFGGPKPFSEQPSDSHLSTHHLSHGDVLLFATDGVWDNLSHQDILRTISRVMVGFKGWILDADGGVSVSPDFADLAGKIYDNDSPTSDNGGKEEAAVGLPAILAAAITKEAKVASLNKNLDGPFAREVQKAYPGEHWRGGKPDDICVVVAVAVQQ